MRFAPLIAVVGGLACSYFRLHSPTEVSDPPQWKQMQREVLPSPGNSRNSTDQAASEANLRHKVRMLRRGKNFLQSLDSYTAQFQKQERVCGELLDEQTMSFKCRHEPFSIFLVWHTGDVGREVLYVDGQNDSKLIAHDGGWKARLPAFSLAPDSTLAMRDARHPVTAAGLLKLIETMLEVHEADLLQGNYSSCDVVADQFFDGHRCLAFTTTYQSANDSPGYRKSMTLLDAETGLPLHTQHFEWPAAGTAIAAEQLDEATLVESYSYTDLRFECQLTDHDFDQRNQEYHFR